jgi:hypothetical protein
MLSNIVSSERSGLQSSLFVVMFCPSPYRLPVSGLHLLCELKSQKYLTSDKTGGGVMSSGSLSAVHNGEKIVIAGLAIQILFFGFFVITCALFHRRVNKSPTEPSLELGSSWRKHLHILYAANMLILIRSVFRLIEYAMGNNGYLLRHEVFLYVFDGVLMLTAMILFNAFHPSGLISRRGKGIEMNGNV